MNSSDCRFVNTVAAKLRGEPADVTPYRGRELRVEASSSVAIYGVTDDGKAYYHVYEKDAHMAELKWRADDDALRSASPTEEFLFARQDRRNPKCYAAIGTSSMMPSNPDYDLYYVPINEVIASVPPSDYTILTQRGWRRIPGKEEWWTLDGKVAYTAKEAVRTGDVSNA